VTTETGVRLIIFGMQQQQHSVALIINPPNPPGRSAEAENCTT